MSDRVVVLSDMQVPYHDPKAVKAALAFVKDYKPTVLLNVGDEIDFPQPSRWSKGWASEYENTLQRDIDQNLDIQKQFLAALPKGAEYHISRSNHGDRVTTYVGRYGPALRSLRALQVETLLGYDELGITYHHKPYRFAPGWVLCHGDEGSLSRIPGSTAKNLALKFNSSVVIGHTHRLGAVPDTIGLPGSRRRLWGVEVGCLMAQSKAHYLKAGVANWQQGIGVGVIDGRNTFVRPVEIVNGEVLY